jgi:H+/Cl- antiporter ClcA
VPPGAGPTDRSVATAPGPAASPGDAPDLGGLFTSAAYLRLLLLCALLGVPASALGFGFVHLFQHLQQWVYQSLPAAVGFRQAPTWWPVPWLVLAGLLVGLTLRFLPGNGGHVPAEGFSPAQPEVRDLPGIVLAALASLSLGAVLGPEAPLIAIGSGLGLAASRYVVKVSPSLVPAVGLAGAVACLGTVFGNPLISAVFLMEGIGIGGQMLTLVLVPGLLAAGVGALVFVGLGRWTGLGSASLVLPHLPHFVRPTLAEVGWSLAMGVAAALVAWLIRVGGLVLCHRLERLKVVGPVIVGAAVAGLAVAFAAASGKPDTSVLFSGQRLIGTLIYQHGTWALGALGALLAFKSLAYSLSLSSFRGGPIFPVLLLGTAGGLLASHLPGFGLVPAIAAGMGAMTSAVLRLPVASVLLPSLLLLASGVAVIPVVIVAVVVSFVVTQFLPLPTSRAGAAGQDAPMPASATSS